MFQHVPTTQEVRLRSKWTCCEAGKPLHYKAGWHAVGPGSLRSTRVYWPAVWIPPQSQISFNPDSLLATTKGRGGLLSSKFLDSIRSPPAMTSALQGCSFHRIIPNFMCQARKCRNTAVKQSCTFRLLQITGPFFRVVICSQGQGLRISMRSSHMFLT